MAFGARVSPWYTHTGRMACIHRRYHRQAAAQRLDPAEAVRRMLTRGYRPIADYPGVHAPWPSIHIRCGRQVTPAYSNIVRGTGGCLHCAGSIRPGRPARR